MRDDPAYRLNQRDAQERWCQKNPGYWKTYREEHPEYTRQNREKQRSRNHLLRTMAAISRQIAKMDAISAKEHDILGYYVLISVQDLPFAKMDVKFVKINEKSEVWDRPDLTFVSGTSFPNIGTFYTISTAWEMNLSRRRP